MSDSTIITTEQTEQTMTAPDASCSECGGNGWVSGEQYGDGPAMMRCPACSTQPTEQRTFQDADAAAAYLNQRIAEAQERQRQQEREQEALRQRDEDARRASEIGNLRDSIERGIHADVLAALAPRYDAAQTGTYSYSAYATFTLQPEGVEVRLDNFGMGAARLHDPAWKLFGHHDAPFVHLFQDEIATDELLAGLAEVRARIAKRAAAVTAATEIVAAAATEQQSTDTQPQILNETLYSRTVLLSADATSAKTALLHSDGAVDVSDLSAYHPKPSEARQTTVSLSRDELHLLTVAHDRWMRELTARSVDVDTDADEPPF